MNIIEVFFFGLFLMCGISVLKLTNPETLHCTIFVFIAGCGVPAAMYFLLLHYIFKVSRLPRCMNNKCKVNDYTQEKQVEEGKYYKCACGDLYFLTQRDEFQIITKDNEKRPYKRRYYAGGPWRSA